jgi:hypothetical protein
MMVSRKSIHQAQKRNLPTLQLKSGDGCFDFFKTPFDKLPAVVTHDACDITPGGQ